MSELYSSSSIHSFTLNAFQLIRPVGDCPVDDCPVGDCPVGECPCTISLHSPDLDTVHLILVDGQ